MKRSKSQIIEDWQSIFLSRVDKIKDVEKKVHLLRSRVCELEKQNKRLKNLISGSSLNINKDEPIKLTKASEFYKSFKWLKLRHHVLSTRNKKCNLCGSYDQLQVDHILPRSLYPEKSLDENNLQILCKDCNYGKLNSLPVDLKTIKLRDR